MPLKSSFANVLRALRNKRNISQRHFAERVSRTYLSKLEGGKCSITLDKLEQISQRLDLSPLTLLALTLSEDTDESISDLIIRLRKETLSLQQNGGLPGLKPFVHDMTEPASTHPTPRKTRAQMPSPRSMQAEMTFSD